MKIKDYIKYVVCTVVVICVVACTTDENEWRGTQGTVQIVGRVTEFKNHTVTSRALKTNEEAKINNMSLFIFEEDGTCASRQFVSSSRPVFVIDRSKLTSYDMANAKIYMLANVAGMETGMNDITDLDDLQAYVCDVESIHDVPDGGFPMMGHMDDVNLTQGNTDLSAVLEIPLTCLYAKMVFNLQVNTVQSVVGYVPAFRLESWEVYNVPETVALAESDFSDVEEYYEEAFVSNESTGTNPVSGSNTLSFSFYLPEHKVEANTWNDYPADVAEDEKQRFKPKRVKEGTKPTFVRIKGSFSNHQGHMQNVSYDIYLGLDNWENFQVLRNHQYNNNIVIKGITNSTDGTEGTISVDHRVNVERSEFTVAMERETMLDCHFEVRPMRVTLNNGGKVVAKVQTGCDWIRLETKNTGGADYCANGKRKYFTTTLMNELSNAAVVTSNEDNCIWAYVDENVDVSKAQDGVRTATVTFNYYADANADVNTATPTKTETYTFAQRYLYPITVTRPDGSTHTYYIEYYEEYLHDFDSENDFNQTDYEGMAWGLENTQLSFEVSSFKVDGTLADDFVDRLIEENFHPRYDFYISKEESHSTNKDEGILFFPYSGHRFFQKILYKSNIKNSQLDLATAPSNAIEYCHNKNKRNFEGKIDSTSVRWYIPSIDEMEEIVEAAYITFDVFQDNLYWSSQPANNVYEWTYTSFWSWITGRSSGTFYLDNKDYARATKVNYAGGTYEAVESGDYLATMRYEFVRRFFDFNSVERDDVPINNGQVKRGDGYRPRSEKNRIRAVYYVSE